jgi:hypothetical protein
VKIDAKNISKAINSNKKAKFIYKINGIATNNARYNNCIKLLDYNSYSHELTAVLW